jgi:hypothetical protein
MDEDWRQAWTPVIESIGAELHDEPPRYGPDRIEAGAVRRYLEPLEFDCALHYDADVARAHGHEQIVAPYTSLIAFATGPLWQPGQTVFVSAERDAQPARSTLRPRMPEGAPPVSAFFATETDIEYLRPVLVGERLGRRGNRLLSCEPKETRVGRGAFVVIESEVVDEAGLAVARIRAGLYLYDPHPAGSS